jgi:signal peptidase
MKLKKKQRKLLIDILAIIAILAGTYLAYMSLQLFLTTDAPLVAIASGSMSPALETGDLVIIQGVSPTNIQVEDILVFDSPQGSRTIHRVTQIQTLPNGTTQFKTKGDANPREDLYWIPEQNVHGRVIYRILYIGWLALDPTIPIIIVSTIVIIIILWPEKRRKLRR